jgi:lipoprotein-anchoring transpeptidase ErfK/SrfK
MTMKSIALKACLTAGLLAMAALGAPGTAAAQSVFYDWNGGTRQTVVVSPQMQPGQIIVSFGDRRLYHVIGRGRAISYPIAIPREESRWEGTTSVSMKKVNPSWTPTPTMRRENPTLPTYVPGGHPRNPLGVRALYLGSSTYRIHGTDAPWTIGQNVSKGCIRMFNEDVLDLYDKINVGTKVVVTWKRFTNG